MQVKHETAANELLLPSFSYLMAPRPRRRLSLCLPLPVFQHLQHGLKKRLDKNTLTWLNSV